MNPQLQDLDVGVKEQSCALQASQVIIESDILEDVGVMQQKPWKLPSR